MTYCWPRLQATAMSAAEVSQEAVYQCTGNPLPRDIEECYRWLMNETIAEAFSSATLPLRSADCNACTAQVTSSAAHVCCCMLRTLK